LLGKWWGGSGVQVQRRTLFICWIIDIENSIKISYLPWQSNESGIVLTCKEKKVKFFVKLFDFNERDFALVKNNSIMKFLAGSCYETVSFASL